MNKVKFAAFCLLLPLLLFGCAADSAGKNFYPIAYINNNIGERGSYFIFYEWETEEQDAGALIYALIETMGLSPGAGMSPAIRQGIRPNNVRLYTGSVDIDMPEEYAASTPIEQAVADAAVVLTVCSLPEIDYVRITINGQPPAFRADQYLGASDILLAPYSR